MTGSTKKKLDTNLKFVYSDNNSLSVIFHDNDLLMGIVGEFNKNLKELEKISKSSLYSRGNSILIKCIDQCLRDMFLPYNIFEGLRTPF